MPDRLTPTQRHLCMSHIHSRDTKPKLLQRYRYRLNMKEMPAEARPNQRDDAESGNNALRLFPRDTSAEDGLVSDNRRR